MAPPPENQAEIDAGNQYQSYRWGWRTGAQGVAIDPRFTKHDSALIRDAYGEGYQDGCRAFNAAMRVAAGKYGIDLETAVLRG